MQNDTGCGGSPTQNERHAAGEHGRSAWVQPRLVRIGSVAQVTAKIDTVGRNDGGTWPKFRT